MGSNSLFGVILGGGLLLMNRPLLKPIFGAAFRLTLTGAVLVALAFALLAFAAALALASLYEQQGLMVDARRHYLIAADAFTLNYSTAWSGLSVRVLRERYGRLVASFDQVPLEV